MVGGGAPVRGLAVAATVPTGLAMPRILLVEDDEDYAHVIRRLFQKAGHDGPLTLVHDEDTALRTIAKEPFDVVLSDLELHPGSGVRVLQKAREAHPAARRILLTSAPDKARTHLGDAVELVHAIWDKHWALSQIQAELRRMLGPSK